MPFRPDNMILAKTTLSNV